MIWCIVFQTASAVSRCKQKANTNNKYTNQYKTAGNKTNQSNIHNNVTGAIQQANKQKAANQQKYRHIERKTNETDIIHHTSNLHRNRQISKQ